MASVLHQIIDKIPKSKQISNQSYEGANIILYTKSKEFFNKGIPLIRELVSEFKKRIELRLDPDSLKTEKKAEEIVRELVLKSANITQILFEPARSVMIIDAQNPNDVIGQRGALIKKIKEETLWSPTVRRDSIIPSKITNLIRRVLHEDSKERRKFLNKVGERIYEFKRARKDSEMWCRISFLGAAQQVGRSAFLLQTPESNILIDCGINPAATDSSTYPRINVPEFDIAELDAVVISHAHLDHCGFLPYIFKYGYNGPIYCTAPTRDIMAVSQLDYSNIAAGQGNKIYSSKEVKQVVKNTIAMEYGVVTDITPDIRLTLHNAGHILGSAMCHFNIGDGFHNLLYSGDYKVVNTKLFNGAHHIYPRVETFITESTYGNPDRISPDRIISETEFKAHALAVVKRKGKLLVPVLGVGRAQEIMVLIAELFKEKKIKDVPVYIDGMVWDITAIHTAYPEFLGTELKELISSGKNPFLSDIFKRVGSGKERQLVIDGGPAIIIATSGMLVGGPSVQYLKKLHDDPKNSIAFVVYQFYNSPGDRMQKGEQQVVLDGEQLDVKMEVSSFSLSGHADFKELMDYMQKLKPRPRKVLVVHGEKSATISLARHIHKRFRIETISPKPIDSLRLR
jgi:KH/beta-lactamase-domain protein